MLILIPQFWVTSLGVEGATFVNKKCNNEINGWDGNKCYYPDAGIEVVVECPTYRRRVGCRNMAYSSSLEATTVTVETEITRFCCW